MDVEVGIVSTVAVAALVTYFTRVGGFLIMAHIPLSPRVERFLTALSGSVLVALVAPMIASGDAATGAAALATVLVMLSCGNAMFAMVAGIAIAALLRVWL